MEISTAPTLRPLGIGQLLDHAIRLYRRNFLKFVGIIAVVQIPATLLQLFFSTWVLQEGAQQNFEDLACLGPLGGLITGLVSLALVQGLATAALTRAVADHYLGESTGFLDTFRKIGSSWLTLIGALILAGIYALLLIIWFLIPCIGWITGLGILFYFGMVVIPLIAPVIVLENQSASQAIRRAWDLARRRFWWVLGFVFVLFLFNQLIVSGPSLLMTLLLDFSVYPASGTGFWDAYSLQVVIQSLVSLVLGLIYLPLQLTCITLMYFDLRVRTEGFDLALQAESAYAGQEGVPESLLQAPVTGKTDLVTWQEMGYFALLTIGFGVLYGVLVGVLFLLLSLSSGATSL